MSLIGQPGSLLLVSYWPYSTSHQVAWSLEGWSQKPNKLLIGTGTIMYNTDNKQFYWQFFLLYTVHVSWSVSAPRPCDWWRLFAICCISLGKSREKQMIIIKTTVSTNFQPQNCYYGTEYFHQFCTTLAPIINLLPAPWGGYGYLSVSQRGKGQGKLACTTCSHTYMHATISEGPYWLQTAMYTINY